MIIWAAVFLLATWLVWHFGKRLPANAYQSLTFMYCIASALGAYGISQMSATWDKYYLVHEFEHLLSTINAVLYLEDGVPKINSLIESIENRKIKLDIESMSQLSDELRNDAAGDRREEGKINPAE